MPKKSLSHENLLLLIDDLLDLEVLELVPSASAPGDLLIPYMMNDAVEYYLTLENCQVMGAVPEEFPGETEVKLVDDPVRPGLIFEMPSGEKLTLWFDRCTCTRNFYQYHRIGHFWREGNEHLRTLVYMIGTIHDKYAFLSPEAVNDEELAILPLVHFGPFRYYSPIDEPLDDRYPENEDGWAAMRTLAAAAGDPAYLKMIDHAEKMKKLPFFRSGPAIRALTEALVLPERRQLIELIYKKVCEASSLYPERSYDTGTADVMQKARERAAARLREEGYAGVYPRFTRGATTLLALEEHPFTKPELDYEGFSFHIHFLMWDEQKYELTIVKNSIL